MTQVASISPVLDHHRLPEVGRQMAEAVGRFLDSLDAEQRARATFPASHWERLLWHYAPFDSDGLPLKDMSKEQRGLARALISTGMSEDGAGKANAIMELEATLGELELAAGTVEFDRDPGLYYFRVFGDPSGADPWGWSVNGHHVYVNNTVVDGELIAPTPSFLGSNPAEVPSGPKKGLRILGGAEDAARELLASLDRKQRSKAIVSGRAPLDLLTGNSPKVVDGPGTVLPPEGLSAGQMSKSQQELLRRTIGEYVGRLRDELAEQVLARVDAEVFDRLMFAWAGGTEKGQPHYFRIHRLQPGSLLVEHDNVQNDANHIHSVVREVDRDFGHDLLRAHYNKHHIR